MGFRRDGQGLFVVTYLTAEEMSAEAQSPLLIALQRECEATRTGIVFLVRKVSKVDPKVPALWLNVTKRLAPRLCAMAIVSDSLAVRGAATTFSIGATLTRLPLDVRTFISEVDAFAWVNGILAKPR